MNLIAIDIGNTNTDIGLFLNGKEKLTNSIAGDCDEEIRNCLKSFRQKMSAGQKEKRRKSDGAIVICSTNAHRTKNVKKIIKEDIGEKPLLINKDIALPIEIGVNEPEEVGLDRLVSAAAAFAVVENAVVIADFGTAVTIDMVDDKGIFRGGIIFPGFEMSAKALHENTEKLPKINLTKPKTPFGGNTVEAINCGLYYSAIATLQETIRRYAEKIDRWPQTIITGTGAKLIKDDCPFVDSYVPNLVLKGIALAYRRYLDNKKE